MNTRYALIIGVCFLAIGTYFFLHSNQDIINYPPKNNTVVAFGDSLVKGVGATEGNDFITLLSDKINTPILNLGVSGETSLQGLSRVDSVIAENPGTVILLFGGNDYLRKVPQAETFVNLREIIMKLQSSGAMIVLLGVRGGLLNDRFDTDFERLAKEMKTLYVPDVLDGLITHQEFMSDTIHPNDAGYARIAEKVYEVMEDYR
ncbi:MAG: GDSL-type esterase/lipase family protein [Patescibacteria group bacterium]